MSVAFVKTHSLQDQVIKQWIDDALNQASSSQDIETRATDILKTLQNSNLHKTRYQFARTTKREEVFELLFDKSFHRAPTLMIGNAEKLVQTSFYPLWKRVCWIQAPKCVAATLDNRVFKIALTIVTFYYFYATGHAIYTVTTQLTIPLVGRVIPFLINKTPIQVIRLGNSLVDVKNWLYVNRVRVLMYSWIGQRIITHWLPEIPHITPLAREISIWSIFVNLIQAPQTIAGFLVQTSLNAATFTWNTCNQASYFLRGRAERAEEEMLAICKAKAYEVWRSAVIANAPAA